MTAKAELAVNKYRKRFKGRVAGMRLFKGISVLVLGMAVPFWVGYAQDPCLDSSAGPSSASSSISATGEKNTVEVVPLSSSAKTLQQMSCQLNRILSTLKDKQVEEEKASASLSGPALEAAQKETREKALNKLKGSSALSSFQPFHFEVVPREVVPPDTANNSPLPAGQKGDDGESSSQVPSIRPLGGILPILPGSPTEPSIPNENDFAPVGAHGRAPLQQNPVPPEGSPANRYGVSVPALNVPDSTASQDPKAKDASFQNYVLTRKDNLSEIPDLYRSSLNEAEKLCRIDPTDFAITEDPVKLCQGMPNDACTHLCHVLAQLRDEWGRYTTVYKKEWKSFDFGPLRKELFSALEDARKRRGNTRELDHLHKMLDSLCQTIQKVGAGTGNPYKNISSALRQTLYAGLVATLQETAQKIAGWESQPIDSILCGHLPIKDFLQDEACFDTGSGCGKNSEVTKDKANVNLSSNALRGDLTLSDWFLKDVLPFSAQGGSITDINVENVLNSRLCLALMDSQPDQKNLASSLPVCAGNSNLLDCLGIKTGEILVGNTPEKTIVQADFARLSKDEEALYSQFSTAYQKFSAEASRLLNVGGGQDPTRSQQWQQQIFSSEQEANQTLKEFQPLLKDLTQKYLKAYGQIVLRRRDLLDAVLDRIQTLHVTGNDTQNQCTNKSACSQCLLTTAKILQNYLTHVGLPLSIPSAIASKMNDLSFTTLSPAEFFHIQALVYGGVADLIQRKCFDPSQRSSLEYKFTFQEKLGAIQKAFNCKSDQSKDGGWNDVLMYFERGDLLDVCTGSTQVISALQEKLQPMRPEYTWFDACAREKITHPDVQKSIGDFLDSLCQIKKTVQSQVGNNLSSLIDHDVESAIKIDFPHCTLQDMVAEKCVIHGYFYDTIDQYNTIEVNEEKSGVPSNELIGSTCYPKLKGVARLFTYMALAKDEARERVCVPTKVIITHYNCASVKAGEACLTDSNMPTCCLHSDAWALAINGQVPSIQGNVCTKQSPPNACTAPPHFCCQGRFNDSGNLIESVLGSKTETINQCEVDTIRLLKYNSPIDLTDCISEDCPMPDPDVQHLIQEVQSIMHF